MRRLLVTAVLALACSAGYPDVTTLRLGLTQGTTSVGDIWGLKLNNNLGIIDSGTAVLSSSNTFVSTNTFTRDINLAYGSANQCLATNSSNDVITQQCSPGSGGSNALAIYSGFTTKISSPTPYIVASTNTFSLRLIGSTTAYWDLLPTTTYFIQNTTNSQVASFNVSTGTVGLFTASTATISSATISGPSLAFSTGTFLNSVAIGTTNVNGQPARVIDTNGSGVFSFESSTSTTLSVNIKNSTAGSSPNLVASIIGKNGDSATGAVNGDGLIRSTNNLYLIAGGASSSRGVEIATSGVSHIYFSDGSTQTTTSAGFQASTQCYNTATFTTSNGSYQTANLACTIVPSATTSRVKITLSAGVGTLGAGQPIVSIFRGLTDLDPGTNGFIQPSGLASSSALPAGTVWIDSPLTASATTYFMKLKSSNGSTSVQTNNLQTMILEEVK